MNSEDERESWENFYEDINSEYNVHDETMINKVNNF